MSIPFEASRLKIWRAGHHVGSLDSEIAAYMARRPAYANIRSGAPVKDVGMVYHEVVVTEAIPIHLSTIVGDIVHNLRTSLDLLACDLVRMNGGDTGGVYFPFAKDATELETMIAKRHIDRAAHEVIDLVRSLKPYVGGNLVLRGIHDLDIIDKHQELVPTHGRIKIPYSEGDPIIPSSGVHFDRTDKQGADRTGVLSSGYTRARNWPLGEALPVSFELTFPQEVPFAAQPLVPWCKGFVEEFTRVVDSFESLCFSTNTKQLPWA